MSEEPKQSYYSKISLANKTPEEAERIKNVFFKEYEMSYLFTRDNEEVKQAV